MSRSKESNFTYYAFVSYSHKDAKWAEWIQRAIEHYKLPAIIRREAQKPLPKRIAPVFRDATDLGVDVLVDGLHEELEKSRFLIVVCSPNSAKPNAEGKHFVDEEVRHFCELGRAKQIIPVIIEGTPEESFGPVLKSKEILALDATKQPKARILNDIVAKILGLKPDALWRRAERERRKRLVIRSILCGILGLAVAFIGLFVWDSNRTVRNYYADYVDSFGLPEGIFPLKRSELAHRYIHYRFEYKGFQHGKSPHADSSDWSIWNLFGFRRRLVRVVQANSRGYPRKSGHTEYSDGCRSEMQDFTYDRDFRLREIHYGRYSGEGCEPYLEKRVEFWNEGGVTNGLIKFFANKGQLRFAYGATLATKSNPTGDLISGKSEITQHLVQRDAKGRVTQRLFLNLSGGNVPDSDGLYGFSYEYDDFGRQTAQWYLFRDGDGFSRCANKKGVAGRRYEYSGRNMHKTEYVDAYGRPTVGPYGWMVCVDSFDEFDNNTESWYFDGMGNKSICTDGYAGCRTEYDAFGNQVRNVYFDTDDEPVLHNNGFAELRMEYDMRGNQTEVAFFGVNGKPVLNKNGYAYLLSEYDEYGNVTKMSSFGVDRNPMLSKDGYAGWIAEYDSSGKELMRRYFGVDGRPTLHKEGYAEVRMEYGECGNRTKLTYFGVDGKPTLLKDGYAGMNIEYDMRGNTTRLLWFGLDGKPKSGKEGFAEMRMEYDERGNLAKCSLFGEDGKLALDEDGVAGWVIEHDVLGNVTRQSYFGVDGKQTLCRDGFAEFRMEYDVYGNRTRELYFGVDGKPTLHKDGHAGWIAEYDERGRETRNVSLGVDGKPTLVKHGYAEYRTKYDGRGNVTKMSCFGVAGNLTLIAGGWAECCKKYDERGNETGVIYFGVDGKPTLIEDGYAEMRMEYDARGNRILESYFGVDGKPMLLKDEYAEIRYTYKQDGTVAAAEFFDVSGNKVMLRQVVMSVEVTPNLAAENAGVKEGDVWCRLGEYDILKSENVCEVEAAMQAARNVEKELVVARKVGNAYEIHSFKFSVGMMGIRFGVRNIPDFDKLAQAYRAYCEKERGENR